MQTIKKVNVVLKENFVKRQTNLIQIYLHGFLIFERLQKNFANVLRTGLFVKQT